MKNKAIKIAASLISVVFAASGISYAVAAISHNRVSNTQSASLDAAEKVLNDNIAQLRVQEMLERQDIESRFKLPEGGSFGGLKTFTLLTDQLQKIKTQRESNTVDQKFEPTGLTVEAGDFKSSALIQWQCAWLKDAVLAQESGDLAKRDADVQTLLSFKNESEIAMFPDYDVFLSRNVYPLTQEGSTANARHFINNGFNCVPANMLPEE